MIFRINEYPNRRAQINFQYRDQTWFSMHECLPGPEEDIENHGRRPRFSTSFEGPGKRIYTGKERLIAVNV